MSRKTCHVEPKQSLARAHARHMSAKDLPIPGPLIGVTEPRWQQRKRVLDV